TGGGGNQSVPLDDPAITAEVLDGAAAADHVLTYYTSESGALNQTAADQITNPAGFTTSVSTTVFIRLDFNYTALGIATIQDCFDVVPLQISIGNEPNVPASVPPVDAIGCVDAAGD